MHARPARSGGWRQPCRTCWRAAGSCRRPRRQAARRELIDNEVSRLLHLHEHGFEPFDVDDATDDEYEVERLLDVADEAL